MNGYLTFLKSLSEYQQRAEIGTLAFGAYDGGYSLEEEILRTPAVAAFSETTLGVDSSFWTLELKHYAEEPDLIGTPVFDAGQCRAPFKFRYVEDLRYVEEPLKDNLVVSGMIYIDDNQSAMIGTLAASSTREKSLQRERLITLGIDPDTLDAVGYAGQPYKTFYEDDCKKDGCKINVLREQYEAELAAKMSYLDYLRRLLPQQRCEAIFYLTDLAWEPIYPLFRRHPKLGPELDRLEIRDLMESGYCHTVGPVEFEASQCLAPIVYPLYGGAGGEGEQFTYGYYVEVHILAGIGNKPGGGGDIWIKDLWSRIESIDDPEEDSIPILVP